VKQRFRSCYNLHELLRCLNGPNSSAYDKTGAKTESSLCQYLTPTTHTLRLPRCYGEVRIRYVIRIREAGGANFSGAIKRHRRFQP